MPAAFLAVPATASFDTTDSAMPDHAALPSSFNIAEHLIARNAAHLERVAYLDDRTELTYGELAARIRRFARAVRDAGLRREERVLLLAHDSVDWPVAFLGTIAAGVVPVAVNTLLTADDYAFMLAHSRARAAIVSDALLPTFERAQNAGPNDVETLWVIGSAQPPSGGRRDFATDVGHRTAGGTCRDARRRRRVLALFVRLDRARRRATVHTHANPYWTDALYARNVLRLTASDVCFSAAKLFFAYGLGNALTFPLSAGATTLLMAERPTPAAVFQRLVERARHRVLRRADAIRRRCWRHPGCRASRRRACACASPRAKRCPREIGERFAAHFGVDILDGIGSTEMLHIFLSNRPGEVRYGTTGVPVPGLRHRAARRGRPMRRRRRGGRSLHPRTERGAHVLGAIATRRAAPSRANGRKSGDKYLRRDDGCYVYAGRATTCSR